MSDIDLRLQSGDTLQLQFLADKTAQRYYAQVIGHLRSQSLVITTPRKEGKVLLVREGQPLVIRMLSGNSIYAFNTSVIRSNTKPYPYLHLAYPKEFETIVVRSAHRARTELVASVQTNGREESSAPVSAMIIDISTTGALLRASEPIGDQGNLVSIATSVTVGSVQHYLTLSGIIRRVTKEANEVGDAPHYCVGVEFQLLEPQDSIVLHGYVYERLFTT